MELPSTVAAPTPKAKLKPKPPTPKPKAKVKPKASPKPKATEKPPTLKPKSKVKPIKKGPWDGRGLKPFDGAVELKIPVAVSGRYVPRRIRTDVRDITKLQRAGLNILMEGLRENDAELNSGQPVNNHVNAIRWMLETIAKEAEPQLEVVEPPE